MEGQRGRPRKNLEKPEILEGAIVDMPNIDAPEGWEHIQSAPLDGQRIMVSATGKDRGVLCYWRISKYVDRKALRYIPKGRWTDFTTRQDITFTPNYWQSYDAEKYFPVGS